MRVLRGWPFLWLAAPILTIAACGESGPALPGSAPSLDALGRFVWASLVAGDSVALESVRLSEYEHNELVWPELPASRHEVNFPVDLAWEYIQQRNHAARQRLVSTFRGSGARLEAVACRGQTESFATFQVLRYCYLVLQDPRRGRMDAQVFRYVHVMNGGYKIFRYYDD